LTDPLDNRALARLLLRATRTAALATLDRDAGGPLTTLVALGIDPGGAPLMLFSQLSQHTKNLGADRRASLLLAARAERGDPLNRPRLTLSGPIVPHDDARAKARYIRQNPKSRLYASFADFGLYRMDIASVHFNGGFGRAGALQPGDVTTDTAGADELIEAEAALLAQVNSKGLLGARMGGDHKGDAGRRWRARSLDPEGLDVVSGIAGGRMTFEARATNPADWLAAFERGRAIERP
jgi:heme iron utilization protein